MNLFLPTMESEHRNHSLSAWFTPPRLAERVWNWCPPATRSVLEPAAGEGALIKPIIRNPRAVEHIIAIDIDEANAFKLRALWERDSHFLEVACGDFMAWPWGLPLRARFDLALMNSPYEDGQAEAFILHALKFAPCVIGIFKASIVHGQTRARELWCDVAITRGVRLASRPSFGAGASGDSAKSDFVVLELVRRDGPMRAGAETWEWWS